MTLICSTLSLSCWVILCMFAYVNYQVAQKLQYLNYNSCNLLIMYSDAKPKIVRIWQCSPRCKANMSPKPRSIFLAATLKGITRVGFRKFQASPNIRRFPSNGVRAVIMSHIFSRYKFPLQYVDTPPGCSSAWRSAAAPQALCGNIYLRWSAFMSFEAIHNFSWMHHPVTDVWLDRLRLRRYAIQHVSKGIAPGILVCNCVCMFACSAEADDPS